MKKSIPSTVLLLIAWMSWPSILWAQASQPSAEVSKLVQEALTTWRIIRLRCDEGCGRGGTFIEDKYKYAKLQDEVLFLNTSSTCNLTLDFASNNPFSDSTQITLGPRQYAHRLIGGATEGEEYPYEVSCSGVSQEAASSSEAESETKIPSPRIIIIANLRFEGL